MVNNLPAKKMEKRLPEIKIKLDVYPIEFLTRIESIATETKSYQVQLYENLDTPGSSILNLAPVWEVSHEELTGHLIAQPDRNDQVIVEVRASKWNPDPPTYDVYVESAKNILVPLLQKYNKFFDSKRRLSIQSKESSLPKLPPKANILFKEFVVAANKNVLHPLDWTRFYRFIYICSPKKVKLSAYNVKQLLLLSGFSEQYSEYLSDVFEHGRNVLRQTRR